VSISRRTRLVSRRAWSRGFRWAGLGAAAVLAAGVLSVAPSAIQSAVPSAKADNCPDVAVTFARGTDEPAGLGLVGQALVSSLRQNTGKNIDAYPVNYRATLLQLHGNDGAKDAIKHIKDVADKCPGTPQVLGGYSQGASVVDIVTGTNIGGVGWGDSLPPQYASHVIAVTTFGNPADRSGGTIAAQSAMFGAKAVDYCNPEDPICHAGQGNQWSGHTDGYVPIYTSQAASFVQTRLLSILPPTTPDGPMGVPPGSGYLGVPPGSGYLGVPPGPAQGPLPGQVPLPLQGPLPGRGPLPGPSPDVPGPTVVSQTQPAAFH
jgi:cutinase